MGDPSGEMSTLAYAGGMLVAFMVDLIGILIPMVGTIFIYSMRVSFFIAGYDMRNTGMMTAINAVLETVPVVPCCMVFMWQAHRKNKINIKEKRKEQKKEAGEIQGGVSRKKGIRELGDSQSTHGGGLATERESQVWQINRANTIRARQAPQRK